MWQSSLKSLPSTRTHLRAFHSRANLHGFAPPANFFNDLLNCRDGRGKTVKVRRGVCRQQGFARGDTSEMISTECVVTTVCNKTISEVSD